MRRKVWVVSPLFYIMAAALLIFSIISFRYDKVLFTVELSGAVLAVTAVLVNDLILKRNISFSVARAQKTLWGDDRDSLENFPLPVAVVGGSEDVVWGNRAFRETLGEAGTFIGDHVRRIIYPKTLRQVMAKNGSSVFYMGRDYTVYGVKSKDTHILYFVDDTYYKSIETKFRERRPVICMAVFDNREEIVRDCEPGEEAKITAEVETVLRNWCIDEMGGVIQKLRNDRFLILTDETHIEKAKNDRFKVLDDVRAIGSSKKMSATISLGIGKDAENAPDSERKALQALDMALGRGGDQVAMMQKGGSFEFFGGLSKGVEKRDKVRTRVIAASITDQVKNCDRVFVMGHKNSDLDSVGAAIGMWAIIHKGLEKPVSIVINESQTLAPQLLESMNAAYPGIDIFIDPSAALQLVTDKSLLIVVDTHSIDFVESRELVEKTSKVIVIDHHRLMVSLIRNTLIFYHEPYASSASEMVTELAQYIKSTSISTVEAQALMAGISLDTKNFVLKTGVRTFEASAFLKRRGADTVAVKRLFANTLEAYKERSKLVQGAEIYKNCAIASSNWGDSGDMRVIAAQAADELLTIRDVKASFVLYKNNADVNISARSLGDINVQLLLEGLGGGGHYTMAGAQMKDITLTQAKRMLISELDAKLDSVTSKT